MHQATEKQYEESPPTIELKPHPETHPEEELRPTASRALQIHIVISVLLLAAAAIGGGVYWSRLEAHNAEKKKADEAKPQTTPAPSLAPDIVIAEEQELKQIAVEPVVEKTVAVEQETTGKVAFNEDRITPVFTPYAGRVVEVLVKKGAVVNAGQPMLIVEAPDYVTAQNDLSAARSEVDKSKIAVDAAQKVVDRLRLLVQREAVASKDLQVAEVDLAKAREELHRDEAAVGVGKAPEKETE